jgi:DNA-directed RNA polymerase specialized sigma24 family protein
MRSETGLEAVTDSTWTNLTELLRLSAKRCAKRCSGEDRIFLEQESDDLVQDFLLRKLRRPAWIEFIHRCAHAISSRHLHSTLHTDIRAHIFRRLKQRRRSQLFPASRGSSRNLVLEIADPRTPSNDQNDRRTLDALLADVRVRRQMPELRQIVGLRLEGFTTQSIASRVGLCEKTVRNRLKAAKILLVQM